MLSDIENYIKTQSKIRSIAEDLFSAYSNYFMHGDESVTTVDFDLDDNTVDIEWEVYWRYGGYDSGSISVPLDSLLNDWKQWLDEKITLDKAEKAACLEKEKIAIRNAELKELKRLKAKYE